MVACLVENEDRRNEVSLRGSDRQSETAGGPHNAESPSVSSAKAAPSATTQRREMLTAFASRWQLADARSIDRTRARAHTRSGA
jgi:hypothetical protein